MIVMYWRVMGENVPDMLAEAKSDAELAGATPPMLADLDLYMITPIEIQNGRVSRWKGWAVICRDVPPELLSRTLMEAEWLAESSLWRQSLQG